MTGFDVLVPVFNGHDALAQCLAALSRHAAPPHRVILLDDASTDPRILPLLEAAARASPHFEVVEGERNRGFVGNVNRGLALSTRDVVLLNADTVVTAGWLDALARCRDSDPKIGIACPLSNNATLLSIPDVAALMQAGGLSTDEVGERIAAAAAKSYPRIPTAVGFCMLITRAALGKLGPFDEAYAPGYGEENDFSMRARQAGFEIAVADDAYVHHEGEASFGPVPRIGAHRLRNARTLAARWPGYETEVKGFLRANPLRGELERARAAIESAAIPRRVRVMQVTNRFEAFGGIEEHVRMLLNHLRDRHAFTIMDSLSQPALWGDANSQQLTPGIRLLRYRAENTLGGPMFFGGPASLGNEGVDGFLGQVLEGGGIDVVHLQSLVPWGSLRFAPIARAHGVPVVLSLHDFFILCPDYNMLLHAKEPCGRLRATAEDPDCADCLFTRQHPEAPAKVPREAMAAFLGERNANVARMLEACSAVVVPSKFLADRISRAYPNETAGKLEVIPHGIESSGRALAPSPPAPGTALPRLRVAFVGRFNDRKGAGPIIAAARRLAGKPIDFEVVGQVDLVLEKLAKDAGLVLRGAYRAAELSERLAGVDLVLIPTLMEETFSLVLSEVQAAGVPFAASAKGAVLERVEHGRTGFLLPAGDVDALVAFLEGLARDRSPLEAVRRALATHPVRTAAECAADYARLYDRVIAEHAAPRTRPRQVRAFSLEGRAIEGPGTAIYRKRRAIEEAQLAALSPAVVPPLLVIGEGESVEAALAASNAQWFIALRTGDTLHPAFPKALADALERTPDARFAFANEDRITANGERYAPVFKTEWDPDADAEWMPGAFCAFRRDAALAAGGSRAFGPLGNADLARRIASAPDPLPGPPPRGREQDFSPPPRGREQDFSPPLRGREQIFPLPSGGEQEFPLPLGGGPGRGSIALPFVLGHRPDTGIPDDESAQPSSAAALPSSVPAAPPSSTPPPSATPSMRVSVVIQRHRGYEACVRLLARLLDARGNAPYEILVPFDEGEWQQTHKTFRVSAPLPGVVPLGFDAFATPGALLQTGLEAAWGEIVAFVRDDVGVAAAGWLEPLLAPFTKSAVAASAAAIALGEPDAPTGTRDAAWVLGFGNDGVAGAPLGEREPPPAFEQPLLQGCARRVSAFAPECFAVRRAAALAVGGFETRAPLVRHGATDLALRLGRAGHEIVASPKAAAHALGAGAVENAGIWLDVRTLEDEAEWMLATHGAPRDPWYPASLSLGRRGLVPETEVIAPPGWNGEGAKRIVALPFDAWGSGFYRVRSPLAALERAGRVRVAMMPNHDSGRAPNAAEMIRLAPGAILAHAALHDYQLEAARAWKRHAEGPLVFGLDDLLTAIPPWNPYSRTIYRDVAQRLAHALATFDRVIVSTEPLAEALRTLNGDIRVIPNTIDPSVWQGLAMQPRGGAKPRFGWAGAKQHEGDLSWLEPVLAQTAKSIDWVFLGFCPDNLKRWAAEVHPMVPVPAYPAALAALGLDLAIAPLADHPFNHAKSNVKLLEYGVLGCPVIATDITPYRGAPVLRLANDPKAWVEALRDRAQNLQTSREEGATLRAWVIAEYAVERHLDSWYNALTSTQL